MRFQKERFLNKVIALSAISMMLMSFTAISSIGTHAASGQANVSSCEKIAISKVGANGERGAATASLAVDNNLNTRWANEAAGSFIQLELEEPRIVCDMDIAWFKGDGRSYNFVVSTSHDGINFKDIASTASTGKTISAERYNLPDNLARYVRVTVHGNSQNDLASIKEMAVQGRLAAAEPGCTIPHSTAVSASGNDGNVPENTIDNDANTRWSNFGFPSWIQFDLGTSAQPICKIDIAWYRGEPRINSFTISASNDPSFRTFDTIYNGNSSGQTVAPESYDVTDLTRKYVRITVNGNNENNNWASITGVNINAGARPSPTDCKKPTITRAGISASGSDANLPQNTLDNDANTRWSNLGLPSWIQYELGTSEQPICKVDIAWYRGDTRSNTFIISASNDPSFKTSKTIFIGKSSGKTISPEEYNVIDTNAKYLRITDMRNSENSWASITEVDINGDIQTPSPSPSPEICGNGIDDDGDGLKDEGCSTGGDTDPFGIQKIYPTKAGGEEWFMDMTDGQDPRSKPPSLEKNSDGSFKVTSSKVRYGVFTSSGYDPEIIKSLDQADLEQKGFMQSTNDWKNFEMTGYVKVNSGDSGENFAWYGRGGRHTGSGNPDGCEGTAYKGDLFYDGRVRFAKEQWHVSYVFTDHKNPMSSIEDKWVGFKTMMWNMIQNGKTVVKMEIWVDKNEDGKQNGPWVKVDENIDNGGWGSEGGECGGKADQILTWGGPVATFRWDGATDVDIKNFSVREIRPPSS
jgi:F5/8 type C domain